MQFKIYLNNVQNLQFLHCDKNQNNRNINIFFWNEIWKLDFLDYIEEQKKN
jgi:hypothetical protein